MSKRRRIIILALTVFALLTFSISGIMVTVWDSWMSGGGARPIVLENGKKAEVQQEDIFIGQRLVRLADLAVRSFGPSFTIPMDLPIFVFALPIRTDSFGEQPEYALAMLRRASIEAGVEVADAEIDASLEATFQTIEHPQIKNIHVLADYLQLSGVAEARQILREAIRITKYVKLEMLGSVNVSDAQLVEYIKEERKKVTLEYVEFAVAAEREELEKSPPSDEDLKKWLLELPDEKRGDPALFDNVRVRADFAGIAFEDADPADFRDELQDTVLGDAEVQQRYERDKDQLYRKDPPKKPDETKDGEKDGAPDKKDEDGGLLPQETKNSAGAEAQKPEEQNPEEQNPEEQQPEEQQPGEQKPNEQQPAGTRPEGEVQAPSVEYVPLELVKDEILRKLKLEAALKSLLASARQARENHMRGETGEKKEDGGDEKKDNENKDGEKNENQEGGNENEKDPENDPEKKDAEKEDDATSKPKAPFDFAAWWKKAAKDRPGLVFVPAKEKAQVPSAYSKIEPFGEFRANYRLGEIPIEERMPLDIHETSKGALFFYLQEREERVLKPIAEIRDEALDFYYQTVASENVEKQAKEFHELVRTKAEGLKKDEVAAHNAEIEKRVDETMAAWESIRKTRLGAIESRLQDGNRPERALAILREDKAKLEAELAKKDELRKERLEEAKEKEEPDLLKILKPVMGEAFSLAVQEKGLTLQTMGPFFQDASRSPRFNLAEEGARKFLMARREFSGKVKEGTVTDVLDDFAEKVRYVAVVKSVEEGGEDAVTRRKLEEMRAAFETRRFANVLKWGWDFKTLEKRFQWKELDG